MLRMWGIGRNSQHGFTLLELLVSLTIIVGLIGLIPLALDRLVPARRAEAEVQKLASELRSLQALASSSGRVQTVQIESSAPGAQLILGDARRALPSPLTARIDLGGKMHGPMTNPTIAFFPDGSSSGGALVIKGDDHQWHIRVSAVLGTAQVQPG